MEPSVVKGVFLPTEEVAFAADISMTSRIPSVLAFVREVQEIGERHEFLKAWLRNFRGVSKHYLGEYIPSNRFRIHHFVPDGLGG